MNRWIRTGICLLVLGTAASCQHKEKPQMTQRELMNRSMLEAYPDDVEHAFIRDYPAATVTSVDTFNDAGGRVVYEINFAETGRMMDVAYTSEGVRTTNASQR